MTTQYNLAGVDSDAVYIRREKFTNNGLWMCGYNTWGQLGDGTSGASTHKSSPVQTVAGGNNWKSIAYGTRHSAAIKTDGSLWSWGTDSYGQLGDNARTDRSSPVQTVAGGTNWKQSSAGFGFTLTIKTDGTLWGWGNNTYGMLGDNTSAHKSSPVQTVAGGTNWKQVACGYKHSAAIKTDGTLWTWGYNNLGQLGDNTITPRSSPVQTIAGGTNWKQVACGGSYMAAIKTDGTLWTWGGNTTGQLGDNSTAHKSSPIQTIAGGTNWKQVSSSQDHMAAIKTDGTLWVWGYNFYGQLGDNTSTNSGHKSSPIQTIAGGTNWKQVAVGGNNTAAIRET